MNFMQPTGEQLKAVRARQSSGPIQLLNLVKFKDKAIYEDGSKSELTGVEAYKLYTSEFLRITGPMGVTVLYSGDVRGIVIGARDLNDAWDAMLLIQYPSTKVMFDVFRNEEYQRAGRHRIAGLEGQLLIECGPGFTL